MLLLRVCIHMYPETYADTHTENDTHTDTWEHTHTSHTCPLIPLKPCQREPFNLLSKERDSALRWRYLRLLVIQEDLGDYRKHNSKTGTPVRGGRVTRVVLSRISV